MVIKIVFGDRIDVRNDFFYNMVGVHVILEFLYQIDFLVFTINVEKLDKLT